jgi:hypothetical protein
MRQIRVHSDERGIAAGMNADMVKCLIGEPGGIYRATGNWSVHEQWEYGHTYYYFENVIFKGWKD